MSQEDRPSPPVKLVSELKKGDRVDQVFLVENSNFKQTRNNKYFIQTDLRDRTGSLKGIRWEADRALFESFQPDDFIHVAGRVEEFQQNLQVIIDRLRRVDDDAIDIAAFLPVTEHDIDAMFQALLDRVDAMENPHLQALIRSFLLDEELAPRIRQCPAGKVLHHATIGGLLEHINSLMRSADLIAPNYPQIDLDLLITGVILHDLGKVAELSYSRSFKYTDVGQLVGHIALGIAWTLERARKIEGFPRPLLHQVLHLIASHHGEAQYGAVKEPTTMEAVLLHYLDNIDAKLDMMQTTRRQQNLGAESGEHWSNFHPAFNRRLYFPQ